MNKNEKNVKNLFGLAVSNDHLLDGRVSFCQPQYGYRAAIDPIFLAAAVAPENGQHILDIGCGAGATSLCLAARCPEAQITGIDNDAAMVGLANVNIHRNGWNKRIHSLVAAVEAPPFAPERFDHVMVNPPYWPRHSHTTSPHHRRATASSEDAVPLKIWIKTALRLTTAHGMVTMIIAAGRGQEALSHLQAAASTSTIRPLIPRRGGKAKRAIIQTRKNGSCKNSNHKNNSSHLEKLAALVLHEDGSHYTAAAQAILRHGAALPMTASRDHHEIETMT